jgi:uncharacterized protein with PQ loop repeat
VAQTQIPTTLKGYNPCMKELVGTIAFLLTFVGYAPYVRDTLRGKTTPHVYTWFIWGLITAIAYALQVSGGAGIGSLVTLAAAIVCSSIAILGLRVTRQDKNIDSIDTACFLLALIALVIWVFAKQPITAVILVSSADLIGFIPTIRKSWKKPQQETLFSYQMNTFRFVLALFALQKYSLITVLYPSTWLVANGLFSIFLISRRRQLGV